VKIFLAVLPTLVFAAYGQLITKWRVGVLMADSTRSSVGMQRVIEYLTDPYIVSAYLLSLVSSIAWLYVVEKHPVSIAFPVYIGALFAVVTIGSSLWLKEVISLQQVLGLMLILVGVVVVSRAA